MHLPHKESHSYRKTKRGKSVKFDIKTQELNIMSSHAAPTPKKRKEKISIKSVRVKKIVQTHQRIDALIALKV